jgi:phenylacetate-coenzyme A ligase PaaK-like adenylate-forming protein
MADFYDRYERRAPRSREAALLRDLRGILSVGKARAPILRAQLKGIDIDALKTRADLAQIPVLRRSELREKQREVLPFGGACATRPAALLHLLMSRGKMSHPQGQAKDWWNSARALFAAGIRKGDIVLNCFSYHLAPEGHVIEEGCRALGCAVIPAGDGDLDTVSAAAHQYQPDAYCGPADHLEHLLETNRAAGRPIISLKRAFLGPTRAAAATKRRLSEHGVTLSAAYSTGELGVVAYESDGRDGLIVNEGLLLEIVKPGTNEPLPTGRIGEIVVSRLNADYPLLRFGTGELSSIVIGQSACGRTNMRIRPPMGHLDEDVEVAGGKVTLAQLAAISARHAEIAHLRLLVRNRDALTLQVEAPEKASLREKFATSFFDIVKLKASIEFMAPGSLDDARLIGDERVNRG